ncbi:MAG: antitoxin VapB family protein [Candidatus Micrarchaeaceae archaeon]
MPKQVMLSDAAYSMLARRKGNKSFSEIIIELIEDKKRAAKDPKKLLEINGIIKTKKPVSWSTQVDEVLYGDKL